MLRLMLNAHPRLAVPPESNFIPAVFCEFHAREPYSPELVGEVFAAIERFPGYHSFQLERARVLDRLAALPQPTLAEMINAIYAIFAAQAGKSRWGDKTPGYAEQIPRLHALFPNCQVIHIIRDGRDSALSMMERRVGPKTLFDAARQWVGRVERARHDGQRWLGPQRYLEIYYEQLVADPSTILKRVCEFLGEQFDPAMCAFHTTSARHVPAHKHQLHEATFRPVNDGAVGKWRRHPNPKDIRLIEAVQAPTLRKHGYPLPGWSWMGWRARLNVRGRMLLERCRAVPRRLAKSLRKRLPRAGPTA